MNTSSLVQKVWNFCHTLRDDGVGYGDYLEQLTYLLFLKLAHEYALPPYSRATHIPEGYDWASLRTKVGEPLESALPRHPAYLGAGERHVERHLLQGPKQDSGPGQARTPGAANRRRELDKSRRRH